MDVSEATRDQVDEFLGSDLTEWVSSNDATVIGVRIRTASGDIDIAHTGDRIMRDEEGLHIQCTRAFGDWETGEFQAAIEAGDAACS